MRITSQSGGITHVQYDQLYRNPRFPERRVREHCEPCAVSAALPAVRQAVHDRTTSESCINSARESGGGIVSTSSGLGSNRKHHRMPPCLQLHAHMKRTCVPRVIRPVRFVHVGFYIDRLCTETCCPATAATAAVAAHYLLEPLQQHTADSGSGAHFSLAQ